MSRGLAVSLGISAAAHAALVLYLPLGRHGPPGGEGTALDAPTRLREFRILLPAPPGQEGEEGETGALPLPASPDGTPAPEEPSLPEGREPEDFPLPPLDLDAWRTVPKPPPARTLPLPPLPVPREADLPIRLQDLRWNRQIGDRIGAQLRLSDALARSGLHGSVRLMLYLAPDGRLKDLRVLDPGPHPTLTLAAQAQVRAAAPFPVPPGGMDSRLLRIPVNLHY